MSNSNQQKRSEEKGQRDACYESGLLDGRIGEERTDMVHANQGEIAAYQAGFSAGQSAARSV